MRDKRLTVGRIDSRFTGMDTDAAGERYEYDSSLASYDGSYVAMFQDYVRRELKWNTDMFYTPAPACSRGIEGSRANGRSPAFGDDAARPFEGVGDLRITT